MPAGPCSPPAPARGAAPQGSGRSPGGAPRAWPPPGWRAGCSERGRSERGRARGGGRGGGDLVPRRAPLDGARQLRRRHAVLVAQGRVCARVEQQLHDLRPKTAEIKHKDLGGGRLENGRPLAGRRAPLCALGARRGAAACSQAAPLPRAEMPPSPAAPARPPHALPHAAAPARPPPRLRDAARRGGAGAAPLSAAKCSAVQSWKSGSDAPAGTPSRTTLRTCTVRARLRNRARLGTSGLRRGGPSPGTRPPRTRRSSPSRAAVSSASTRAASSHATSAAGSGWAAPAPPAPPRVSIAWAAARGGRGARGGLGAASAWRAARAARRETTPAPC